MANLLYFKIYRNQLIETKYNISILCVAIYVYYCRCCGAQIVGCYAPNGEHCERPLEVCVTLYSQGYMGTISAYHCFTIYIHGCFSNDFNLASHKVSQLFHTHYY